MPLERDPRVPDLVRAWVDGLCGGQVMFFKHDGIAEAEVWLQDGDRQRMAGVRLSAEQLEQALALMVELLGRMRQGG